MKEWAGKDDSIITE